MEAVINLLGNKTFDELLAVALASVVSLLLRSFLVKPDKMQIKLVSQLLSFIVVIALKWFKNHHKDVVPHLEKIRDELHILRNKTKKDKIILG